MTTFMHLLLVPQKPEGMLVEPVCFEGAYLYYGEHATGFNILGIKFRDAVHGELGYAHHITDDPLTKVYGPANVVKLSNGGYAMFADTMGYVQACKEYPELLQLQIPAEVLVQWLHPRDASDMIRLDSVAAIEFAARRVMQSESLSVRRPKVQVFEGGGHLFRDMLDIHESFNTQRPSQDEIAYAYAYYGGVRVSEGEAINEMYKAIERYKREDAPCAVLDCQNATNIVAMFALKTGYRLKEYPTLVSLIVDRNRYDNCIRDYRQAWKDMVGDVNVDRAQTYLVPTNLLGQAGAKNLFREVRARYPNLIFVRAGNTANMKSNHLDWSRIYMTVSTENACHQAKSIPYPNVDGFEWTTEPGADLAIQVLGSYQAYKQRSDGALQARWHAINEPYVPGDGKTTFSWTSYAYHTHGDWGQLGDLAMLLMRTLGRRLADLVVQMEQDRAERPGKALLIEKIQASDFYDYEYQMGKMVKAD